MPARLIPRSIPVLSIAILACGWGTEACGAGEHPRLLITPGDIPRLRHACGIGQPADPADGWGKFGRSAADFQAARAHFSTRVEGGVLPGELLAAAFLHLLHPDDPTDAGRLKTIDAALEKPQWITMDGLEMVLALDWCWPELDPAARREFLLSARARAEPFTPADSPLEPRSFREKLAGLALALAVDEDDDPNPSWATLRARLLEAGRSYFEVTFPVYVKWRGLSPTSPAVGAREECDTALGIELAGLLLGRDLWPGYRDPVGRWLEHYVFATLEHPALQHNFLRDEGTWAPLSPAPPWRDLLPLTAHLIAARTRDPAAALVAKRVVEAMRESEELLPVLWRWVPIVLDTAGIPCCDLRRLPTARNFGGSVVFRGGLGPQATAVWIDAGQPFLRRRQHFDAGHFLVYRGGHLVVGGGDDVAFEAIPSKRGFQRLGEQPGAFDFEQYFTATIAHNCLLVWDAARISRWHGALYQPAGGQRCIEGTCTDFRASLAAQRRQTGRQLAYGQRPTAAYLALDLAAAYEPRALTSYTREFVFVWGGALVVIDRVALPSTRSAPTWIVNLPARPQVDGHELRDDARVTGSTNQAGVWRYDRATWLRWSDRDGCLWLSAPRPTPKHLRVVGGPAGKLSIEAGTHAGRTYVGGEADGYERLIIPAERHGARNAWYRLGEPTLLGPQFGHTPHWGRIEIEPAERAREYTFLTLLVTDRAAAEEPPSADLAATTDGLVLTLRAGEQRASLRLAAGMDRGGVLEIAGKPPLCWELPTEVLADEALGHE